MAFKQATADGAILLLDEADSLLSNREAHSNSWETTQVNELLTQMECYQGILIAATNFNSNLDPAVARRFDFKLEFNYLDPKQVLALFAQINNTSQVDPSIKAKLKSLQELTPGDFATVKRQMRLRGIKGQQQALELLNYELSYKQKNRSIGFLA